MRENTHNMGCGWLLSAAVSIALWIGVIALLVWALGCMTVVRNQGEVGIRFGNEVTFFSRSAQTAPEPATAELKSQPLSDWLDRKAETPPTPEAGEGDNDDPTR